MNIKLLVVVLLTVFLLPVSVSPPEAEAVPDCEAGWCEDTFEAGGRMHDIGYLEQMTIEGQAAQEAVIKSFAVLQPIWGEGTDAPFSVSITILPTSPANWAQASEITHVIEEIDGNATVALEVEKCHIEIFNIVDPLAWLPSVAHEMGHCFQYHYIDTFVYKPPDDNWWADGSAEWMATLVYPEMADNYLSSAGRKDLFSQQYFSSLYAKQYDAVFFWHFLEGYLGQAGVIDFLVHLPAANSMEDYHDYLKSALPDADDAMQQFALAVYRDQIPYQPPSSSISPAEIPTPTLPFGMPIGAQTFGIDYRNLTGISVSGDNALRLVVNGSAEMELRVTLVKGATIHWLQDGEPVDLCDPPDSITLALSRTGVLGDSESPAEEVEAALEVSEVDSESADCLEEAEELPACMVGTWQVIELPEQATPPGVTAFWEPSNYYLTLNPDGTFEGAQLDMTLVADAEGIQSETSINMEFSGSLSMEPVSGSPDQYEVVDLDVTFDSASFVVNLGGETVDMTDIILGMGAEGASLAFKYFTCIDADHLQYTVEAEGIQLIYMTEKAP